ncbi:type II toxin-antitoxin system RelE/ParE family toxin [Spongiibacter sp. KMU-158]|uniref:Type II toxin-antitoxin system RelE/ParE family toxin n=1 Tax=Spongiibacter pelagi TaxID=2760804 RepID=A0A927C3B6_9GAMM|nr:type II toxin-antitoxin system RelE/ParE family toxin [Spongiibacter pelagi]MBD2859237.1 type II toxin-antitoxin system RelE/ParE family toxin [Spongiibacter pelagi]
MRYSLRLRDEAGKDIEDAASWYEAQLSGLGQSFLDILEEIFSSILESPLAYPMIYRNIHRAVLPKFPFSVFYFVRDTTIVVIAVMHGSRHPSTWQRRR